MSFEIFDSVYKASANSLTSLESQIKRLSQEIAAGAGLLPANEENLEVLRSKDTANDGKFSEALDNLQGELIETREDGTKVYDDPTDEQIELELLDIDGDGTISDQERADFAHYQLEVSSADKGEGDGSSTSVDMLLLQKYVGEWTVLLGLSTGLLKSLADGLQGVTRNI